MAEGNGNGNGRKAGLALTVVGALVAGWLLNFVTSAEGRSSTLADHGARIIRLESDRRELKAEITELRSDVKELTGAVYEALNKGSDHR